MATSKCPSYGSHSFEMVEHEPRLSKFKMMFTQCSNCGAVIGVTEFFNIGALLNEKEERIKTIERRLNYAISLLEDMRRN